MANEHMDITINNINEEYEDKLFKLAMQYASEKEGRQLLEEMKQLNENPQYQPIQKEKFVKALNMRLKEKKAGRKKRSYLRVLNKVAVVMLAFVIILSAAIITVDAFRVQVLNLLISVEQKYTSIHLNDKADSDKNSGTPIVNWSNTYVPTYVPEGFTVSSISNTNAAKIVTFANTQDDSMFIIYTEYASSSSIAIDTENASLIQKVKINGQDGTLSVKNSIVSIAWTIENHLFTVQGNLSSDEIIKVAENVRFVE